MGRKRNAEEPQICGHLKNPKIEQSRCQINFTFWHAKQPINYHDLILINQINWLHCRMVTKLRRQRRRAHQYSGGTAPTSGGRPFRRSEPPPPARIANFPSPIPSKLNSTMTHNLFIPKRSLLPIRRNKINQIAIFLLLGLGSGASTAKNEIIQTN